MWAAQVVEAFRRRDYAGFVWVALLKDAISLCELSEPDRKIRELRFCTTPVLRRHGLRTSHYILYSCKNA